MKVHRLEVLGAGVILAILTPSYAAAWDPVRDLTGRTLKGHVERRVDRIVNSTQKFLHNPVDYTLKFPAKMVAEVCAAGPNMYEGTLHGQVGQWFYLPPNLIAAVQPHYSVDLRGVKFAVDIRTSNGAAQTFGNAIYFPQKIYYTNPNDMRWLLHELEHVVQYAGSSWGTNGKLCEYMVKGLTHGLDHDSIDMEEAADRKADAMLPIAMAGIQGSVTQVGGSASLRHPLQRNELWIRNENPFTITFYLRTEHLGEAIVMQPFEQRVFRGTPTDWWFYIEVPNSIGAPVAYTLMGATKQHIAPRQPQGYLDVFWSQ